MARTPRSPSLWYVPDPLWTRIEPLIESGKPKKGTLRGRPRQNRRHILDGIIFKLRTGCQWNSIPPLYGSDSTIYRYFQTWTETGVFEKVWAVLVEECPELAGVWSPSAKGPHEEDQPERVDPEDTNSGPQKPKGESL